MVSPCDHRLVRVQESHHPFYIVGKCNLDGQVQEGCKMYFYKLLYNLKEKKERVDKVTQSLVNNFLH